MAYQRTWDEAHPPGTLPADQIDTAIQDAKIALRERLEQVIPGFGDDGVDPKRVRAVYQGQTADRPDVDFGGAVFVDLEEGKVQYTDNNGDWQDWPSSSGTSLLRGTAAERPNPATADFYYATDTGQFFVKNESEPPAYVQIAGGGSGEPGDWNGRAFLYIPNNAEGSRASNPRDLTGVFVFGVIAGPANLNADGFLLIPWADLETAQVGLSRDNVDTLMVVARSRATRSLLTGEMEFPDPIFYDAALAPANEGDPSDQSPGIMVVPYDLITGQRITEGLGVLFSFSLIIYTSGEAPEFEVLFPLDFRAQQLTAGCPAVVHQLTWNNGGVESLKTIGRSVDDGQTWQPLVSDLGPGVTEYEATGGTVGVPNRYRIKFNSKTQWAETSQFAWCDGPGAFVAVHDDTVCPTRAVDLSWNNGAEVADKVLEVSTNFGTSWTLVADDIGEAETTYRHEGVPVPTQSWFPIQYRIRFATQLGWSYTTVDVVCP